MKLVLRLDADPTIGFGHAVRTAALVAALGPTRVTVCGRADPGLFTLLPTARIEPVEADLVACARRIAALAPDLVICDLADAPASLWPALRQFVEAPVVAVDDYGGPVDADLIVNGTVLPAYHQYPAASASTELLSGGAYALLRAPFGKQHWRDPHDPRVTLVIGSGTKAARWLEHLLDGGFFRRIAAPIDVVAGWGFARPELLERISPAGAGIYRGLDADALARRLARSSVVLCTGGMIVYETLAVGAPAVVLPQMDNLVREVRWFASQGAITGLDPTGDGDPDQATAEVKFLMGDAARREALSRRGSALIDGRGVERVAATIRKHLLRDAA